MIFKHPDSTPELLRQHAELEAQVAKNVKGPCVSERVNRAILQAFGLKLAHWNVGNVLNIKKKKAELYIIYMVTF